MLLKPIEQGLPFLQQLFLAIEQWLEALIEFALEDLWQIFQQKLVAADLSLGRLQLVEGGQMLLFLTFGVGHRRRIKRAG
ncbi:MAG: hypothetical protein ACO3ZD_05460 [Cyanobium sp.]